MKIAGTVFAIVILVALVALCGFLVAGIVKKIIVIHKSKKSRSDKNETDYKGD